MSLPPSDTAQAVQTANFSKLVGFLWSIADLLNGSFSKSQFQGIILPFTVLRRLDCVLEPTKAAVLAELDKASGGKTLWRTLRA